MIFSDLFKPTTELNGFILFDDSLLSSGQKLLNYLYGRYLTATGSNHRNIWFINFSLPLHHYKSLYNLYKSNFIVIDCYSNPLNWNKHSTSIDSGSSVGPITVSCDGNHNSIVQTLQSIYQNEKIPSKLKERPLIIVNSLSSLILKDGLSETCNLLRTLMNINLKQQQQQQQQQVNNTTTASSATTTTNTSKKNNKITTGIVGSIENAKLKQTMERTFSSVFGIFHSDLHYTDRTIHRQLEYLSTTAISVTPLPANIQLSQSLMTNPYEATITIINKKRSGRVVRNVEYYYQKNGIVLEFDSAESLEKKPEAKELDPTENLSFNLKLSEEERAAKDAVVLPYMRTNDNNNGGNLLIIEDPDEEDYDDEDPDDDLDI